MAMQLAYEKMIFGSSFKMMEIAWKDFSRKNVN